MKKRRSLGQAGDTIVEVLIVLAVLGLAFAISYATANHGLIQARNAQEHSEALGIINSQVELVRDAFAQHTAIPQDGTAFCMKAAAPVTGFSIGYPTAAAADDDFSKYPNYAAANDCHQSSFYYVSAVYDTAGKNFDFRVRWDGLGSLGRQQEELTYKIEPINDALAPGYIDNPGLAP